MFYYRFEETTYHDNAIINIMRLNGEILLGRLTSCVLNILSGKRECECSVIGFAGNITFLYLQQMESLIVRSETVIQTSV